jgi:hypothetical protein
MGFDPRQRQRIFPLPTASRPALGPTQPPIQCVLGAPFPGVNSGRGVMLTANPLLMPKSASVERNGTTLPLPCSVRAVVSVSCLQDPLISSSRDTAVYLVSLLHCTISSPRPVYCLQVVWNSVKTGVCEG